MWFYLDWLLFSGFCFQPLTSLLVLNFVTFRSFSRLVVRYSRSPSLSREGFWWLSSLYPWNLWGDLNLFSHEVSVFTTCEWETFLTDLGLGHSSGIAFTHFRTVPHFVNTLQRKFSFILGTVFLLPSQVTAIHLIRLHGVVLLTLAARLIRLHPSSATRISASRLRFIRYFGDLITLV